MRVMVILESWGPIHATFALINYQGGQECWIMVWLSRVGSDISKCRVSTATIRCSLSDCALKKEPIVLNICCI